MATQKKAATKKGIKVRDLKPAKDAKGGRETAWTNPGPLDPIQGVTWETAPLDPVGVTWEQ